MNCTPLPWTERDDDFLRTHYPTNGIDYCAEKLKRSRTAIVSRACRIGVKITKVYVQNVYMDRLKTQRFAYLLGYLWADGCLYTKDRAMKLLVQKRDGDYLHEILDYTGVWRKHLVIRNGKSYWLFCITDKRFCDLLTELGYDEKSVSSFKPVIDWLGSTLTPHFLLGFFDGDGSVMQFSQGQTGISFAGRHDYDWTLLLDLLREAGIESARVVISDKNGKPSSSALVCHKQIEVLRFYRRFVQNSTIGLPRKREAFQTFVQRLRNKIAKKRYVQSRKGRFYPIISYKGKMLFVGTFDSLEDAHAGMEAWEAKRGTDRHLLKEELAKLELPISSRTD